MSDRRMYTSRQRRAMNIIWTASGEYDFQPDFMAFQLDGEPDFYMIECMNPEKACVHNQSDSSCKVHRELYRIQKQLARELSVHSIKEIMEME